MADAAGLGVLGQPGLKGGEIGAGRRVPAFGRAVEAGAERLGLVLLGIRHGEIDALGVGAQRGVFAGDQHGGADLHGLGRGKLRRLLLWTLFLASLEAAHVAGNLFGVRSGLKNFPWLVCKYSNPGFDVAGATLRVVSDAKLVSQHERCYFYTNLFFAVPFRSEWMSQIAVQSAFVTAAVSRLMERRFIKQIGVGKLASLGQRDPIVEPVVIGGVARQMADRRAEMLEDGLGPLVALPLGRDGPQRRRR